MAVRRCLMVAGELQDLMLQEDPQGNRGLNQLQLLHLVVSSLMHLRTKTTHLKLTQMGYVQSTTNAQIHLAQAHRSVKPIFGGFEV